MIPEQEHDEMLMTYPDISETRNTFRQERQLQRRIIFGNRRYWFHIIIWLLVFFSIAIPYGDFSKGFLEGAGKKASLKGVKLSTLVWSVISGCMVAAAIVYSFLLIAIPYARYKMRKRYLWIALMINCAVILGVLIVTGVTMAYLDADVKKGGGDTLAFMSIFSSSMIVLSSYFFSFYYFVDLYDQQRGLNQYQEVFRYKLQAETNFLKTQINPHFLFNTLNNIYSLTLSKSGDAPRITEQLKDLISYIVNECALDMVPLEGEISFLRNYIALERLRNREDNTVIELDVQGDAAGREIAPLLLVNFIENAFKHGVKSDIRQSFVRIVLNITGKVLTMEVANSKPPKVRKKRLAVKQTGGIGIRNVRRRLEILYHNRYRLRISDRRNSYHVYLRINL